MSKRMKASRSFRETQIELLQDPENAALYLEEALTAGDMDAFKLALVSSPMRISAA